MLGNIFDEYERKARLYPALIALSPVILNVYFIIPEMRELSSALVSLVISLGLLELLAYISRSRGKSMEKNLFAKWGGAPATRLLRHSDNKIDTLTKSRYHKYLSESISNFETPSPENEAMDITSADKIYESGIRWLREKTRDKKAYPLVFKENVGYGFSRNLWALRPISIFFLIASIVVNLFVFYIRNGRNIISYTYEFWISNTIAFLLLFVWIFFINKAFVENSADSYARALLATCDTINKLQ